MLPGATIELVHEPRTAEEGARAAPVLHASDEQGLLRLELAPGTVRAVAWSTDACALPASAKLDPLARTRVAPPTLQRSGPSTPSIVSVAACARIRRAMPSTSS